MPLSSNTNKLKSFYQGDSFTYRLSFDDTTFDIRGYQFIITFKISVSDSDESAILIKRFTPPDNSQSTTGIVYFPFESTDTNKFCPGSYHYDIQMVTNDFPAKVVTLLKAQTTVKAGVSQFQG